MAEGITGDSHRYQLFQPFGLAWNGGAGPGGGPAHILVLSSARLVAGAPVARQGVQMQGNKQACWHNGCEPAPGAGLDAEAGGGGHRRVRVRSVQDRERPAVAHQTDQDRRRPGSGRGRAVHPVRRPHGHRPPQPGPTGKGASTKPSTTTTACYAPRSHISTLAREFVCVLSGEVELYRVLREPARLRAGESFTSTAEWDTASSGVSKETRWCCGVHARTWARNSRAFRSFPLLRNKVNAPARSLSGHQTHRAAAVWPQRDRNLIAGRGSSRRVVGRGGFQGDVSSVG